MTNAVLTVKNISKSYKDKAVLQNVSFNVPEGSIYGLIGQNGAGKTTLLRILARLIKNYSGSFFIFGQDGNKDETYRKLAFIIEAPCFYENLTAEKNLKLICDLKEIDYKKAYEVLELVGLNDTGKKITKHFSLGMKQRLAIAIALIPEPEFLILDEPMNGLDPISIRQMRDLLLNINKNKNKTILITSHILSELSQIATHYGIIDNGAIVKEFNADTLTSENISLEDKFIDVVGRYL